MLIFSMLRPRKKAVTWVPTMAWRTVRDWPQPMPGFSSSTTYQNEKKPHLLFLVAIKYYPPTPLLLPGCRTGIVMLKARMMGALMTAHNLQGHERREKFVKGFRAAKRPFVGPSALLSCCGVCVPSLSTLPRSELSSVSESDPPPLNSSLSPSPMLWLFF